MNYQEPSLRGIIDKYVKVGFDEARKITKEETHKHSKEIKDAAWASGSQIINGICVSLLNYPPEKKYPPLSRPSLVLTAIITDFTKTFQNAFRLAEEGYYRSAFGELRDLLELAMMMKLFYEEPPEFDRWYKDPNVLFTTKKMRRLSLFMNSGLNNEIKKLSNALSRNRHSSSKCLDSRGKVMTNICYYRKDLFDKWCKHLILMEKWIEKIYLLNQTNCKSIIY